LLAAGEDFRAADQKARVDAEGITDKSEDDDGSDAKAATATHRNTKTTAATHSATAAVIATVIDVIAAAEIVVTHGGIPSPG
jgi:hypothetical protein